MKKLLAAILFGVLLIPFALLMTSCEGDSDSDDNDTPGTNTVVATNAPAAANVSGVWSGTRADSSGSSDFTLALSQNNTSLGGNYADNNGGYAGTVSGTISGSDVDFIITISQPPPAAGNTWRIQGSVNEPVTRLTATVSYSIGGSSFFTAAK